MTTFFNLPSNILSTIYEMDSTYRDKIKKEINKEIYTSSFDIFRKNYIKNLMNQHLIDKFDVLLKFIFDKYLSEYEIGRKQLFPDQIYIYTNYAELYEKSKIYVRVDDYSVDPEIDDSEIFEGWIYTHSQYNDMLDEFKQVSFMNKRYVERSKQYIAFQNDKYVIAYVDYGPENDSDNGI